MNELVIKVARKGEGKTKWLLDVANKHIQEGKHVYLFTEKQREYERFCEKYFATYATVCKVDRFETESEVSDAIVLIDDLFSHETSLNVLEHIHNYCYKMFITIEGSMPSNNDTVFEPEYEQLTLFDAINN